MNILQNNPYRLLGIYANSSARDQLASIHKLEAYLRVGRQTALPLELPGFFPVEEKTVDGIKDAAAKLALPQSKLHYAQFWFLKIDQFDEIAFKHLLDDDIAKAMEIWGKHDSVSSLQNRIVCHLIQNNLPDVIRYAEKLYGNAGYISQFVSSVVGEGIGVNTDNLGTDFIDALAEEVGFGKLLPMTSIPTWQQHIKQKSVAPLLSSIQEAIDKSKQSRGKGAAARLTAGNTLMKQTKPLLTKLQGLLPKTDMQYQSIVDRLANEILQCGIDYFNNSEDDDAPQKAMVLQKYALSIAAGPMAMDRCKENVEILEKIGPEYKVRKQIERIAKRLSDFKDESNGPFSELIGYPQIEQFVNSCRSDLMAIKDALGVNADLYVNISSAVASTAINAVVKKLNAAQQMFGTEHMSYDRSSLRNDVMRARDVMRGISLLDMSAQCRSYFNANSDAIDRIYVVLDRIYDGICDVVTSGSIHFHPTPTLDPPRRGGCYIATMVYGDYDHPQVMVLRYYRDTYLAKRDWGKRFIRFYYKHSPGWVERLKNHKRINQAIKLILDSFVSFWKKASHYE